LSRRTQSVGGDQGCPPGFRTEVPGPPPSHLVDASGAISPVRTATATASIGQTRNPKIGLIYSPTPDLLLRASYGASFRAPALRELNSAYRLGP